MNQPNDGLTDLQRAVADEIRKDGDSSPNEYTRDEKLKLVASDLMDPKEVGMVSAEEAKLELLPEAAKTITLGDAVNFQCGIVPLEIRAEWARQDLVVVPTDISAWKKDWMDLNRNTFRVQGVMQCGTAVAKFERTFSDPTLGLALMLKIAGEMLEKQYLGQDLPPSTDSKKDRSPDVAS